MRNTAAKQNYFGRSLPKLLSAISIAVALMVSYSKSEASTEILHALGSGFGKISPIGLVLCALMVIGVLGFTVFWEIRKSLHLQREKLEIGWQFFNDLATQKNLSPLEIELLKKIVESSGISSADMVFESATIYEEALDTFLHSQGSKMDKEELLYAQLRGLRLKLGFAVLPKETPWSSTRQLEVNKILTLNWKDDVYKGVVTEVNEKNWFLMLVEPYPQINVGEELIFSCLRSSDGEYVFTSRIAGLRNSTKIFYMTHTRELERKQMRNWVRAEVNIPCRVTVLKKSEDPQLEGPQPMVGQVVEGRLADLSGGGACARFASAIPKGYILALNFDLPGSSLRGVECEVMRLVSVQKNGRDWIEHNFKFKPMETVQQEKIVRYVFEKQRLDSQTRVIVKNENKSVKNEKNEKIN